MKRMQAVVLLTAGLAASGLGRAQMISNEFFRLDFNLKEVEGGKVVNTRNFQMMARTEENATSSIRAGGRVPVTSQNSTTYVDVGVNIDVKRLTHIKDELSLDVVSEVSGGLEATEGSRQTLPVIRQTRWNSVVLVTIRKPTTIFSSDDPASKRQLQLEVTATPLH